VSWDIAACGTLHRDDITTPHGRADSLGGSAVYFAMAAATFSRVHVNGIVGSDTSDEYRSMLRHPRIDMSAVVVSRSPTFRWHAVHDFQRWVTADEWSEPGCDAEWQPALEAASANAPVLFLGSMHPRLQLAILDQSHALLVGADSMTVFMRDDRESVLAVAAAADILFLNADEVQMLAAVVGWRAAARALCGRGRLRAVVVKQGPDGASCVTSNVTHDVAAHPVELVVDPTGAGDALAGGFLGRLARDERADDELFENALRDGARCAAAAVKTFGVGGLQAISGNGGGFPPQV